MRKVVISTCHGGFGLSRPAFTEWARRKDYGMVVTGTAAPFDAYWAVTYRPFDETPEVYDASRHGGEPMISCRDIQRDDPDLVEIVEQLGQAANDQFSCLKVVEIPDDVAWHVDDYDGSEWVAENHRRWS